MTTLSSASELKVVNGMIVAIEQTLVEFRDPISKSELYRELSSYHARQAALEISLLNPTDENSSPAAVPAPVEETAPASEPEVAVYEEDDDDDDIDLDEASLAIDNAAEVKPGSSFATEDLGDMIAVETSPDEDNEEFDRIVKSNKDK